MKYVACDLCGADEPVVVAETGRSGLPVTTVICPRCGLVYTNPIRELSDYSGEAAERMRRLMKPAGQPSEKYVAKSARRAAAAADFLGDLIGKDTHLLDVGCAAGQLLVEAKKCGALLTGIEPEPAFADFTRKAVGCEVHGCLLEDAPLADGAYDLVTASHVLEHTSSPAAFLSRAHALLRPNAHIFIEVPNVLQPRCSLRRMFHVAHRYNFSPTTAGLFLRKAGFEICRAHELNGPGTVQLVGRRLDGPAEVNWETDGEDHCAVLRRLRRHRIVYYLTGLFLSRKFGGSA